MARQGYARVLAGGRILLALGLLAWLIHGIQPQNLWQAILPACSSWEWLMAGLALTFAGLWTGAYRWQILLNLAGIPCSAGAAFRYFFVGQFFNAFMLGACGGDVARAVLVARGQATTKTEAATSVILDRALGLFVTVAFACLMAALRLRAFWAFRGARLSALLMFLFLLGACAGFFILFHRNLFERWTLFRRLEQRTRMGPLIRRAYEAFYFYRKRLPALSRPFWLSVANLACLTLACAALGRTLGLSASLLDYFTLFPIITVLAAIPLTPGSLGVREGLFVSLFRSVGVGGDQAMLLSLLVYATSLLWSLFGGVLFMTLPLRAKLAMRQDVAADKPPIATERG